MTIEFNHTVISAHDNQLSAHFWAEILGLPAPTSCGPFKVVQTHNGVNLDFVTTTTKPIQSRHFAFLISETEFDEIFARIVEKNIPHWADHTRDTPGEINHNDGGRGVYFLDPNEHFLEIITRPYGSGDVPANN